MSDNTSGNGTADSTANDPLTNVKAEFTRKLGNLENNVATLAETNKQLISQIQALTAPKQEPASKTDDLEELWYKDPRAAAAKIQQDAEKAIEARMARQQAATAKTQATLTSLVRDYPELNNDQHPLTKRAVEIYNALPEEDKTSPMAYKLAVKEAALEVDMKPINKRTADDSFTMGTGSSADYRNEVRTGSKSTKIDPKTLEVAKIFGLDIENKDLVERLNKYSKRNWQKYE